uniref:protein translocase subunit SecDF n=1 Tax=Eubacterium cellulosolvens TaxID=29322 RepID=UPI000483D290|nr:protein translocase subunit SecDF [[Eubacterium] cellulosolvens]
MKKKQSIAVLLLLVIVTVFLGFTAVQGLGKMHTGAMKNIRTGLDLSGGVSITYEATEKAPSQKDMDDTIYKLQQRVTQYSTEANVYQQGLNRINVEIPGVSDANEILEALGKPGSLVFTDSEGKTVLEGSDIASAEGVSTTDQQGQRQYLVELTMTKDGTKKFQEATAANVGKQIAIVYDGKTVSAPTVKSEISGGKAQIDGMSSLEEAQELASFIRIGSLKLELKEIYSNVVGASLGQEALSSSVLAGLIGVALVVLFMIVIFRLSGFAAGWALVLFTLLDLVFMNAFDITLTLPGIAGVILTIGMAVDANVIIYTRVREEIAFGGTVNRSLRSGFHKAFSAIFDGQITTLIAAAVLYVLGTGSIQGFATTLAIGTGLSMFTALAVSRWISYALYGAGFRSPALYGKTEHKKIFDFVGKRTVAFVIAVLMILSVPVGIGINRANNGKGMNYSLDFVGGTATTVDFGEDLSLADLDSKVKPVVQKVAGNPDIQFQKIKGGTSVIIKTRELDLAKRDELNESLAKEFKKVDASKIEAENISSTISGEMRQNAIIAVIIAVIAMLFYIFVRFRDMRFATSAVIALVHDISIVLCYYVWTRASVGSTFIAVMLTILGYSINATIVIFDRVRENLSAMQGESYRTIVNASVTQTLTRSLYSNLTTFITIFTLFVMASVRGISSVAEFSLPIIVGLVAGCFSSVFVTGPLWFIMKTLNGKKDIDAEVKKEDIFAKSDVAEVAFATAGSSKKHVKKDRSELSSTPRRRGKNRR